jgi:hypothetical protein
VVGEEQYDFKKKKPSNKFDFFPSPPFWPIGLLPLVGFLGACAPSCQSLKESF